MVSKNLASDSAEGKDSSHDSKCEYCGKEALYKNSITYFECIPPSNVDVSACKKHASGYPYCMNGGNGPIFPDSNNPIPVKTVQ